MFITVQSVSQQQAGLQTGDGVKSQPHNPAVGCPCLWILLNWEREFQLGHRSLDMEGDWWKSIGEIEVIRLSVAVRIKDEEPCK